MIREVDGWNAYAGQSSQRLHFDLEAGGMASRRRWDFVRRGWSDCSQSDLALSCRLGRGRVVSTIEIEWPTGTKDRLSNVPANQFLTIEEARGPS